MPFNKDYTPSDQLNKLEDAEYIESVTNYLHALGQEPRLRMLSGFIQGENISQVANRADGRLSSLSEHANQLMDAELIYNPSEKNVYHAATPLGHYALESEEQNLSVVAETYEILDEHNALEDPAILEGAFNEEKAKKIESRKWERAWDEIKEHLGVEETSYTPEID